MLINHNSHFPHWTKAPHVKDTTPGNFFDNISVCVLTGNESFFKFIWAHEMGNSRHGSYQGTTRYFTVKLSQMHQNSINEYIIAQADVTEFRIVSSCVSCWTRVV